MAYELSADDGERLATSVDLDVDVSWRDLLRGSVSPTIYVELANDSDDGSASIQLVFGGVGNGFGAERYRSDEE